MATLPQVTSRQLERSDVAFGTEKQVRSWRYFKTKVRSLRFEKNWEVVLPAGVVLFFALDAAVLQRRKRKAAGASKVDNLQRRRFEGRQKALLPQVTS